MIEKLPGSVGDKAPPADVIVNIIAVLNNLVVESPMAARDIVYFDGLRKLFYIKRRRDRSELPVCSALLPQLRPGAQSRSPLSALLRGGGRGSQPGAVRVSGLGVGSPQTSSVWFHGHLPALCHLLRTPHHGAAHRCSHLLPTWALLTSSARSSGHPAHCGGLWPLVLCLFPPALSLSPSGPFWGGVLGLVGTSPCLALPKAHCTLSMSQLGQ